MIYHALWEVFITNYFWIYFKGTLHEYYIIYFSLQSGKYTDSLELAKAALKWEEKELGNRPDRMVELYGLMAEIYDEVIFLSLF